MNTCSPNSHVQIPNKKSRLILPSIPSVKKIKIMERRSGRSISPIAVNNKLNKQNGFDEKINKIKDELIKFRKAKESDEKSNYNECLFVFDKIMYCIKI